jgi:hypothetical protein
MLSPPVDIHTESGCDSKNPHPKGWGYTDEARLRGLRDKIDLRQPDLVSGAIGLNSLSTPQL